MSTQLAERGRRPARFRAGPGARIALLIGLALSTAAPFFPGGGAPAHAAEAPMIVPASGTITSKVGRGCPSDRPRHQGIDIALAGDDIPVVAAYPGRTRRGFDDGGWGNYVEVQHTNGYMTRYGHLRDHPIESGREVEQGERIGTMGNTGGSEGQHLHFEVWLYGQLVNTNDAFPACGGRVNRGDRIPMAFDLPDVNGPPAPPAPPAVENRPSVTVTGDGNQQVFTVRGNTLWQNWFNPFTGGQGSFVSHRYSLPDGEHLIGSPATHLRAGTTNVVDIVARSNTGHVYFSWYDANNGNWGGWTGIGHPGAISSDPTLVARPGGSYQIVATTGFVLATNWIDPYSGNNGGWDIQWNHLPGDEFPAGTPAATRRGDTPIIDIITRSHIGRVYFTWTDITTGQWGAWHGIGHPGAVDDDPTILPRPDGTYQVFATGGFTLTTNWIDPSTGNNGGWAAQPSHMNGQQFPAGTPSATPREGSPNIQDVFVRAHTGDLYFTWHDFYTGNWGGWHHTGAWTNADPTTNKSWENQTQIILTQGDLTIRNWFDTSTTAQAWWGVL